MAFFVYYFCLVVALLVNSVHNEDILLSQRTEAHPATLDFSRHTLVKPRIYHGREKRQISSTKEEQSGGEHINHLSIEVDVDNETFILDLTINKKIISEGFFHRYQKNGTDVVHKPSREEIELCHYHGKVRGKPDSFVALSTCYGLSGVIWDGTEMHFIESGKRSEEELQEGLETEHFLYKESDIVKDNNKKCGYENDGHSHQATETHLHNRALRYKRDADQKVLVRGPYNANKDSKYVELVLVVDNREFKEFGESRRKVEHHCKSIANIINGLYAPLNIYIALVGVVVWSEHDEISFSANGDQTLTSFLHYRREKLVKDHPNDNAQLLTKFNFENGVVGKALKGPICTYQFSGGVNTDHSPVVGLVATTVAHEMGHNFGMEHDTNECKCPEDKCIMAPSSGTVAPTHWSSCSLNYLLFAFTRGMDYCLKNKPESLFESPVCGNGFVEPGEQCDCGLPEHCDNTCCNATSCMLHSNASCATGECCDLKTCMPKTAGTLCRSADYECDLPEYCTGQSEYCPPDIYKLDTEVCDGGKAYCYHGFCRTRTDQCKLLWGETGMSSDKQCYVMNIKGTRHGNCGYNVFNQTYTKCDDENILCGMLHCKHLNERLEFGMESVATLSHSFINKNGSIIPCRSALVDLGVSQIDPGLAPDGAKCGEGKMCVNQRCMSVSSLRLTGPKCPQDCNGNGWCNSLGHCHCKDGFAPPYCDGPGVGGSEDSGPAIDPNGRKAFANAMFIIFLGIIPLIAIIAFLLYYLKYNFRFNRNKKPQVTTSKSPIKSRSSSFPSEIIKRPEDNHSLLHEDSPITNDFFGNFKGFSIKQIKIFSPEKNEAEPIRAAPPPPSAPAMPKRPISPAHYTKAPPAVPVPVKSPTVNRATSNVAAKANFFNKSAQKYNSLANGISTANEASVAPALPPPNPGSNARPIISSPVLENSTCTAKELISPLRNAPKTPFRSAPEAPNNKENQKPQTNSTDAIIPLVVEDNKKSEKNSALNRIASFLKPTDKKPAVNTNSLPRTQKYKVKTTIDKETLRNMEISNPIPQTEIEISITALPVTAADNNKAVLMRAQSMRNPNPVPKPNIQTFGSMRQTNAANKKRPISIPNNVRPKIPPPPLPPLKHGGKSDSSPEQYDDCLNKAPLANLNEVVSPASSDNIYAVIDDNSVGSSPEKSQATNSSSSNDNMGLLSEIVSEIQNRNFDSIYSTSTLARKKKEQEERRRNGMSSDNSETYVNTSSIYKSPDSEYSNMSNIKSSASSTSSGYIHPSAVNVPMKKEEEKKSEAPTIKPYVSPYNRQATLASSFKPTSPKAEQKNTAKSASPVNKTPPSPTNKGPKTNLNRQTTPPNLRTRKPSPTRTTQPVNRRSITNSPDLVTSCNTSTTNTKSPDVVNGGTTIKKPTITSAKPALSSFPKAPGKTVPKSVSFKSPQAKTAETKPPTASKLNKANSDASTLKTSNVGLKNAAKQSSNVASLQQKFEKTQNTPSAKNVSKAKT